MGIGNFDYTLLRNVADVLIVAYLIYRCLLIIKGTRAAPMLSGLTVIALLYFISRLAGFLTLGWILENFLSSILLIAVIIFQDEIRRGLTKVGLHSIFRGSEKKLYEKSTEDITLVCAELAKRGIGALIVIQREVGLDEFVEDAVILDAALNRKLLYSLFVPDSKLHDGAVLIERGQIRAASCVLPLSFDPDLDPDLGTRHRAALGLSERSDAVIIVISEETGAISFVRDGRITRNLDPQQLRDILHQLFSDTGSQEKDVEEEVRKASGIVKP